MGLEHIEIPCTDIPIDDSVNDYLTQLGITNTQEVIHNPSYEALIRDELSAPCDSLERAQQTNSGATSVRTGKFTGRSPKDKYIVLDEITKDSVWWTSELNKNDNKPITRAIWQSLYKTSVSQLSNDRLYIVDGYCGANKNSCLRVRFIVQVAWQAHFVKNMFIQPSEDELESFVPDFVVMNAAKAVNSHWVEQGLHSENFVAFNIDERIQLIGGTWYGGEMKKGLFSMMNYFLPRCGIATMHSAANRGKDGDVALFFGLSGTGKTTLSADANRALIGDDEHGWDDEGIFNLEGGCYAKTIDLDPEKEPEIYSAIKHKALLENVAVDSEGNVDFYDTAITENTRVSYPISHIENRVVPVSKAGHAKKIIFLTADAFGVLPPVSVLTPEQAQYHYLSGFTAKVAGTERGITEPTPAFSACFGQAFLTLHPTVYADVLATKMAHAKATAYLVNTGWNGTGKRIDLAITRAIISAILNDGLTQSKYIYLPYFNLKMPTQLLAVEDKILDPRCSYDDASKWETKARKLAGQFIDNFKKFSDTPNGRKLAKAGPTL